jgi:hypothetical protein
VTRIKSVFFDVDETLVDETREYGTWADWLGVPRHTFSAVFGARSDMTRIAQSAAGFSGHMQPRGPIATPRVACPQSVLDGQVRFAVPWNSARKPAVRSAYPPNPRRRDSIEEADPIRIYSIAPK